MGILRGAFIFMADLVRAMDAPVHCQFINMYYKDSALKDNIVKEIEETRIYPAHSLAGRNVLLVATVLDTGITMDHLLGHIREQGVQSVRMVTLIDKPFMRRVDLKADYAAFESQDAEFIFGYGLDYQEKFRNLPFPGQVPVKTFCHLFSCKTIYSCESDNRRMIVRTCRRDP